ncbi:hypothetical protein BHE74_00008471 [Ensete ventricosum]|nr:hypothetical protein BHE74_00008471 [Ensete ventricosum]
MIFPSCTLVNNMAAIMVLGCLTFTEFTEEILQFIFYAGLKSFKLCFYGDGGGRGGEAEDVVAVEVWSARVAGSVRLLLRLRRKVAMASSRGGAEGGSLAAIAEGWSVVGVGEQKTRLGAGEATYEEEREMAWQGRSRLRLQRQGRKRVWRGVLGGRGEHGWEQRVIDGVEKSQEVGKKVEASGYAEVGAATAMIKEEGKSGRQPRGDFSGREEDSGGLRLLLKKA